MFHYRKQKKKKVIILICFCFLLFLIYIFWIHNTGYYRFELGKKIQDIGVGIKGFFIPKIEEYHIDLVEGINRQLEEENLELKRILELDLQKYHTVHANVISRELDWYQEIVVDKGKQDGIEMDMAVISNQSLIGRVSEASNSSSVIKLLTSNSKDMKIAVDIKTETNIVHGILNGYLAEESSIRIDNIPKDYDIKIGDKVYTNGLGGIYPSGIYIGTIVEIGYDSLSLYKIAKIQSDFSYDILRYVTIIDRRKEE